MLSEPRLRAANNGNADSLLPRSLSWRIRVTPPLHASSYGLDAVSMPTVWKREGLSWHT